MTDDFRELDFGASDLARVPNLDGVRNRWIDRNDPPLMVASIRNRHEWEVEFIVSDKPLFRSDFGKCEWENGAGFSRAGWSQRFVAHSEAGPVGELEMRAYDVIVPPSMHAKLGVCAYRESQADVAVPLHDPEVYLERLICNWLVGESNIDGASVLRVKTPDIEMAVEMWSRGAKILIEPVPPRLGVKGEGRAAGFMSAEIAAKHAREYEEQIFGGTGWADRSAFDAEMAERGAELEELFKSLDPRQQLRGPRDEIRAALSEWKLFAEMQSGIERAGVLASLLFRIQLDFGQP